MSWFSQIVALNASAAALLQQNEIRQARSLWIQALRMVQPIFEVFGEDANFALTCERSVLKDTTMDLSPTTSEISMDVLTTRREDLVDLYQASPIYNRIFLIRDEATTTTTVKDVAAILLYNIGLVSHVEGFRTGRAAHTNRAVEFYNRSFAIVHDNAAFTSTCRQQSPLALLTAALCHNLAECYGTLCRHELVQVSVDSLMQIVHWMETTHAGAAGPAILSYKDHDFFQASLFFTKRAILRHAAAA